MKMAEAIEWMARNAKDYDAYCAQWPEDYISLEVESQRHPSNPYIGIRLYRAPEQLNGINEGISIKLTDGKNLPELAMQLDRKIYDILLKVAIKDRQEMKKLRTEHAADSNKAHDEGYELGKKDMKTELEESGRLTEL